MQSHQAKRLRIAKDRSLRSSAPPFQATKTLVTCEPNANPKQAVWLATQSVVPKSRPIKEVFAQNYWSPSPHVLNYSYSYLHVLSQVTSRAATRAAWGTFS